MIIIFAAALLALCGLFSLSAVALAENASSATQEDDNAAPVPDPAEEARKKEEEAAKLDALLKEQEETKKEIDQLNSNIKTKKNQIDDIKNQIDGYNQKINATRERTATIENEIELLGNKIKKTELDIERTQKEIDMVSLEIRALDLQIVDKNQRIEQTKAAVAEYLRTLNSLDGRSELEVLLANNSFSEFFDQIKYLEDVEKDIKQNLDSLVSLKQELVEEEASKTAKKTSLADLQKKLDLTRLEFDETKDSKLVLVDEAKQSEADLRKSLQDLRNEQAKIDSDLAGIQARLKEKLRENDKFTKLPQNTILSWPVSPERGISAYFHDPDYPYRYVFEHPAIDIRAAQGVAVRASAGGFVARAKNGGLGYSYVMVIHPGNLSTVYGHLSRIIVAEDQFVERGQVIGYSGGTPGTPGAGRLTTGPHLHFEVRVDGIPANPLKYLLKS